ncbi:MAG: T9SS type A sorting domain-containing protein [bacterium]
MGIKLSPSGVANTVPFGVTVSLTQNPATNFLNLTVSGVRSAEIGIFDLLGKSVAVTSTHAVWHYETSNLAPGSYIVHISGVSESGEQFVTSKRIVIAR